MKFLETEVPPVIVFLPRNPVNPADFSVSRNKTQVGYRELNSALYKQT